MRTALLAAFLICCILRPVPVHGISRSSNWILTEYADLSGKQGMFYSLYNAEQDSLILIDGGWTSNADTVREVIRSHGGHVRAWILTHYHEDHCGAFNALWNEYRDRIDFVYANPLDAGAFKEAVMDWDTPETFELFHKQTTGAGQLIYLYRDDCFELDGLSVRVFNSYDEEVRMRTENLANDCSLVFSVTASKDSFLFLADMVDERLGRYLLERYGSEALHADYVQAAHHGNWGQPAEFYEAIRPKELFFDAPEWLMVNRTEDRFDARLLKEWCEQNGVTVHDFTQAPTTIILE